jgi:hypothetical protein
MAIKEFVKVVEFIILQREVLQIIQTIQIINIG